MYADKDEPQIHFFRDCFLISASPGEVVRAALAKLHEPTHKVKHFFGCAS
jgi:hypothetical protein